MDLKQIIAVTLRNNPGKSPDELASIIDERVKFMAEMGGLAMPSVSIETPSIPLFDARSAPGRDPGIIILPGKDDSPVPARSTVEFTPPARLAPEEPERELCTLDQLHSHLDQILPKNISVSLPNIDKPFNLMRVLFKAPKPEMQYVRITYNIPGQTEGPAVLAHTTKPVSKDDILAEVQKQCEMKYTATPRKVNSVAPPAQVPMGDVLRIMQTSSGAEVGPEETAGPDGYQAASWPDHVPYTGKS